MRTTPQAELNRLFAKSALVAKPVAAETTKERRNVLAHRENAVRGSFIIQLQIIHLYKCH